MRYLTRSVSLLNRGNGEPDEFMTVQYYDVCTSLERVKFASGN